MKSNGFIHIQLKPSMFVELCFERLGNLIKMSG